MAGSLQHPAVAAYTGVGRWMWTVVRGAAVLDSAAVRVVVGAAVAVLDDEAAGVTEVGVVLGVPLDEQLDIAMANAVDNIAVTHRRMARRLTWIATVSRILDLDSQVIQGLPAGLRL